MLLPEKWVKTLFMRFEAIYGNLWSSRHKYDLSWEITLREWQLRLGDITGEQIKKALEKCGNGEAGDMPPTLPKFRTLCLMSSYPEIEEAFLLAIDKKFTHPVIQLAREKIISWDWATNTEVELKKKWKKAYECAIKEYQCDLKKLEYPELITGG